MSAMRSSTEGHGDLSGQENYELENRPSFVASGIYRQRQSSQSPSTAATVHVATAEEISLGDSLRTRLGEDGQSPAGLEPVDRGRGAWTFCFSALALETIVWGLMNAYGVFQEYYASHAPFMSSSPVAISTIGTIALALSLGEGLLVVSILHSFPDYIKPIMCGSAAVCTLSFLAASFAQQLWALILCQGVLFGVSGGFLYYPAVIWLPEWFVERRGLAAGIIFGGSGAGGAIFPLLINALLGRIGFRWTLRALALLFAAASAPAVYLCRPRLPITVPNPRRIRLFPSLRFAKQRLFLLNSAMILCQMIGYYAVSVYLPTYARGIGLSQISATLILVAYNIAGVFGKVLAGWLVDWTPYLALMLAFGSIASVSAFLAWGYASSVAILVVFAILFGSTGGTSTSVWPAAAVAISGPQLQHDVSVIFLAFGSVMAAASITGPTVAGALIGPTLGAGEQSRKGWGEYGYAAPIVFVGASMAVSSLLAAGTAASRIGSMKRAVPVASTQVCDLLVEGFA